MCQKCNNNCNTCNCSKVNVNTINHVVCQKNTTKIIMLKPKTENSLNKEELKKWLIKNLSNYNENIIVINTKASSETVKETINSCCLEISKKIEFVEGQYCGDYK